MKRTFLVKKDPTIEAQDNWLIMDYRQYAAWRETDEGKNREIVFGKFEACSEDDSIIFMECNEKVSKELKKDCHRKQYIRSRDAETPFQVMSYSTMTFQESEIYGEDNERRMWRQQKSDSQIYSPYQPCSRTFGLC